MTRLNSPNKTLQQLLDDELYGLPGVDSKIAKFIRLSFFAGRWHSYHKGYSSYGHKELNKVFGKGGFIPTNESMGLFDVLPYSYHDKYTRALRHTSKLIECFNRAIDKWKSDDTDEQNSFSKSGGVLSRDASGNNANFNSYILKGAKVNSKALRVLIDKPLCNQEDDLIKHKRQSLERIQAALMLATSLDRAKLPKGWIPQTYVQHKTGRVYSGGISLQNCCTAVREAALDGLYGYDISNCHWAILNQVTKTSLPLIEYYLANKAEVRESLSVEFGLTLRKVKTILTSMIYGAMLLDYNAEHAIAKECGSKECYDKVRANPLIKGLYRELKLAARELIKTNTVKVGRHAGKVINTMGLVCDETKSSKKLSHILQGYEAKALEVVTSITRTDTAVLLHDGWVTCSYYEPEVFEQVILDEVGLHLTVEFTPIECTFKSAPKSATSLNIKELHLIGNDGLCQLRIMRNSLISITNLNQYFNTKLIEQYPNLSHKHQTICQTTNFAQNKIRLKYLDS